MKIICLFSLLFLILFSGIAAAGDEQTIKNLCANGGIVTLESRTYTISECFSLHSNTELKGQSDTILEFASNCGIPQNVPMIDLTNVNNVKITGIKFRGNQDSQTYAYSISNPNHPEQNGKKAYGNQLNTFIFAKNCNNLTVTECDFYDNLGDGLRCSGCSNIEFSYNTGSMGGHDVLFCLRSSGVRAHNNNIKTLVNSAIRLLDVNHARIYNNIISWDGPRDAGPVIQIQHDSGTMQDIEICGNKIQNSYGPAFWIVGKTTTGENVWIHHNLIEKSGSNHGIFWVGGIIASGYDGILLENNCFDGSYLGAVNFYAVNSGWATSATATLKNNLLINAVPGKYSGAGGYGIFNDIDKQQVQSSGNCFWNNMQDIKGSVTSQGDSHSNPDPSFGVWTCSGGVWSCPNIEPSSMGYIPSNSYDGTLTDDQIEEFEFNDIFDILSMNVSDYKPSQYHDQTKENISTVHENAAKNIDLNHLVNPVIFLFSGIVGVFSIAIVLVIRGLL